MRKTRCALIAAAMLFGSGLAIAQPTPANPQGPAKTEKGKPETPGKAGETPGKAGATPGKSGETPGKSGEAPGKTGEAPGKSGETPAQGAEPPGKSGEAPGKAGETPGKAGETPAADDPVKVKEREARRKKQIETLRPRVLAALKGTTMHEAIKAELVRHAERTARLERIQALATEAKDDASLERAKKLLAKEDARHDKFLTNFDPKVPTKVGAK